MQARLTSLPQKAFEKQNFEVQVSQHVCTGTQFHQHCYKVNAYSCAINVSRHSEVTSHTHKDFSLKGTAMYILPQKF